MLRASGRTFQRGEQVVERIAIRLEAREEIPFFPHFVLRAVGACVAQPSHPARSHSLLAAMAYLV